MGDCLENVEYIYGKKCLWEIDCWVCFLIKWFEVLKIVDFDFCQEGKVYFGVWVWVENELGE